MPKRRAVVFDLGGVLLRTGDHEPRYKWDRRLGLPLGSVEAVVHGIDAWRQAQLGEIDVPAYWEAVANQLHLNPWELGDLQQDFYSGDRFDLSLIQMIKTLRLEELGIGLLSNNSLDVIDMLTALRIRSLFDVCVISAEIGVMKPDPAAYQAIIDRFDLPPAMILFVDDVLDNVSGARRCGMGSIQFFPDMDFESAVRDWISGSAQPE